MELNLPPRRPDESEADYDHRLDEERRMRREARKASQDAAANRDVTPLTMFKRVWSE